jgi:hypothetical protein
MEESLRRFAGDPLSEGSETSHQAGLYPASMSYQAELLILRRIHRPN